MICERLEDNVKSEAHVFMDRSKITTTHLSDPHDDL